jgi:magnesium chelatase family protein
MLVASMNPCPCGYYGDLVKECMCSLTNVLRYQKRISGPLLDRKKRFAGTDDHKGSSLQCNGDMGPAEVRQDCVIDDASKSLLRAAMQQMQLSARVYHRTRSVKLARTIADLAGCDKIETPHLAEAIQYRPRKQI